MLSGALPGPALAGTATDRIRVLFTGVNQVINDPAEDRRLDERLTAMRELVTEVIDFRAAAKLALGSEWAARTPVEQDEFVALFSALLQTSVFGSVGGRARFDNGLTVRYLGEGTDDAGATVATAVLARSASEIKVAYRMTSRDGAWMVYDVIIDGVSLVDNYRAQFTKVIHRSSYSGLVAEMRARLADLGQTTALAAAPVAPTLTASPTAPLVVATPAAPAAVASVSVVPPVPTVPPSLVVASAASPVAIASDASRFVTPAAPPVAVKPAPPAVAATPALKAAAVESVIRAMAPGTPAVDTKAGAAPAASHSVDMASSEPKGTRAPADVPTDSHEQSTADATCVDEKPQVAAPACEDEEPVVASGPVDAPPSVAPVNGAAPVRVASVPPAPVARPAEIARPQPANAPLRPAAEPRATRPVSHPGYWVQVGAFRTDEAAIKVVSALGDEPVSLMRLPDAPLLRVLVGPFANREAAATKRREIKARGIDGFVAEFAR
jgi:phospholipid transport system substrate-binding protein